jgi:hypothetical protein
MKNIEKNIDQNNSKKSVNLYTLLFSQENKVNVREDNNLIPHDDDDFADENNNNKIISPINNKIYQEQHEKRLNEKDKTYKFKKHFFLKDSYIEINKRDYEEVFKEFQLEQEYLKNCEKAEESLKYNRNLTKRDVEHLLKRNYIFFTDKEKQEIEYLKKIFHGSLLFSIGVTIVCCSILRSSFVFFNLEGSRKFWTYSTVLLTGGTMLGISQYFINKSYAKKLGKFCIQSKEKILNDENKHLKVPYDEKETKFNPEDVEITNVFKV